MDPFWPKVALSFLFGGFYVAFSLLVAERFGPKWGGFLAGLPSTTLVGLLFIGWTQGVSAVVSAIPIIPAAVGICGFFVVAFVSLSRFGANRALLGALAVWFVLTLPLAFFRLADLWLSIAVGCAALALSIFWLRGLPEGSAKKARFIKREFLARGFFAGLVIAFAVVMTKYAGPIWGGMFVGFPAAYSSSIFFLSRKHGTAFAASASKMMPVGTVGIIAFLTGVYFAAPILGLLPGIFAAYLAAVVFALAFAKVLKVL